MALQKLKEKQAAEAKAAAKPAAAAGSGSDAGVSGAPPAAAAAGTGGETPFVMNKKPSSEVFEARKKISSESVLSIRKKGAAKKAGRNTNAALLRAQKDIAELSPSQGITVTFPDPDDIMHFNVAVRPVEGLWKGAEIKFRIDIPLTFPYDPPKATCDTLVYHPNIDYEGHVCLNILRADWVPVLNLGSVLFGLMTLFLEPNPDDPLNRGTHIFISIPSHVCIA